MLHTPTSRHQSTLKAMLIPLHGWRWGRLENQDQRLVQGGEPRSKTSPGWRNSSSQMVPFTNPLVPSPSNPHGSPSVFWHRVDLVVHHYTGQLGADESSSLPPLRREASVSQHILGSCDGTPSKVREQIRSLPERAIRSMDLERCYPPGFMEAKKLLQPSSPSIL